VVTPPAFASNTTPVPAEFTMKYGETEKVCSAGWVISVGWCLVPVGNVSFQFVRSRTSLGNVPPLGEGDALLLGEPDPPGDEAGRVDRVADAVGEPEPPGRAEDGPGVGVDQALGPPDPGMPPEDRTGGPAGAAVGWVLM